MTGDDHTIASCVTQGAALRLQAERYGDRPFLFFEDESYSFAEIDRRADRIAAWLQQDGVRKGDRVAVMIGNRPDYLWVWFGVTRCGAVLVPINTAHRGQILDHMLRIAGVSVLFVEQQFRAQVDALDQPLPDLRSLVVLDGPVFAPAEVAFDTCLGNGGTPSDVPLTARDPATILFTSGTTGPSKGSLKTQFEGVETGRFSARNLAYTADDRILIVLPLFHGNAQFMGVMAALVSGAQVVLADRFSARQFWPLVARFACTAANYVGSMLQILLKAPPTETDAANSLTRMNGSGAAGALASFESRFGVSLIEGYGATEFGVPFLSTPSTRRVGSCGVETGMFDVRLVDDGDIDVPVGTIGELLVRPRVPNYFMLGYVGMPEATVAAWRDLWFHTGDLLRRDVDGYYYFVDRKKDALRRRGENVSSFELEQAVMADPDVVECAIVAVASDLGEDDILLCVVPARATVDVATIHAALATRVAAFMIPRFIRVVDMLPRTPTQRVEKFRLRDEGLKPGDWDATTRKGLTF